MAERDRPELRVVAVEGRLVSDPPGEQVTEILDTDEPDPRNQFTPMLDRVEEAVSNGIKAGHTNAIVITLGDDDTFAFDTTDEMSLTQAIGALEIIKSQFTEDFRLCEHNSPETEDGPPSA